MKQPKKLTYNEAIAELELIVKQIENEEIDLDMLTDMVKRADYLCKFCMSKLKSTEEEVKSIISDNQQTQETDES